MKPNVASFIDHVFEGEEMNGGYGWTLVRIGWLQVRLHHFTKDDWLGDMHDHPGRCVSIGLKGKYREETPKGAHIYQAPWVRTFPASHTHRIMMVDGGTCWTLAITLKPVRTCGVFSSAGWMPFEEYLKQRRD
jgi:hypothetical protein